ncbi:MAG: tRNA threonylcarbamoyladenosine dehydratase [Methylophilaceae bacterium]|nr:tRNA threonylcarbamoyladenosine dehydratase [Methylophilaceae bacterium]
MEATLDSARRFSGVRRLYGETGLARLQAAHVVVIGIGGVGSWAAEALVRNAVGQITLVDLDHVAESNVNRQIHALASEFGKAKVTAMRERMLQINPGCIIHEIEDFITPDNINTLLNVQSDIILDCIDDAKAKEALASFCKLNQQVLMMSGSAGGRLDPTRTKVADLALVTDDKLLSKVRNQLRRHHGFPKASVNKANTKKSAQFGLPCVYSDEPVIKPDSGCEVAGGKNESAVTGLNCAGYGSSVAVTATFGFVAAQWAINQLVAKAD